MTEPTTGQPEHFHDVAAVAEQLGVTEDAVTELARAGALRATWVPSRRAFFVADHDLAAYKEAHPGDS